MRGGALVTGVLAAVAGVGLASPHEMVLNEQFRNGVNVVLGDARAKHVCLTMMRDRKNLELRPEPCDASNAAQVWYFYNNGMFGVDGMYMDDVSDNAGAVQVHEHDAAPLGQDGDAFAFLEGDKILNKHLKTCLAPGFFSEGNRPTQFLKYVDCTSAPSWHLREANIPRRDNDHLPSVAPQVPELTPRVEVQEETPHVATAGSGAMIPHVESHHDSTPKVVVAEQQASPRASVAERAWSSSEALLSEKDHYLCICVVSKDDDKCVQAVRAACTVGHIPAEYCRESFEEGNHDLISSHVVQMIDHGARCGSLNPDEMRSAFSQESLPVHALHGQQLVTAEDHYLCVCLSSGGDVATLDQQCEDAVKVACMVGHIPETECFESFDEHDHSKIADRIMRMIDSGANCAKKLQLHADESCPSPPCYHQSRHSARDEPSAKDHYLCPCMDDHQSVMCKDAVSRACKLGHIPRADCQLAEDADYRHAVTRHVLHLIDHGAECGLGSYMTFSNRGCHCKNTWTAANGETITYPDNCRDPGGEKGFDWCETYAEEGCLGVGESMSWDRCDNPRRPRYHLGQFVQTSAGKVSPVDHYLCVCVDKTATDEGCLAAVKAGCQVGHIPSDACAQSFQQSDHSMISDHILEMISHGARCNNIAISTVTQTSQVPRNSIASGCGHGVVNGRGECECHTGFAGVRCDFCAVGYVGYPECSPKRDCNPACQYGSCDFGTGTCRCPASRQGPTCYECAQGYSGSDCSPGFFTHHWFLKVVLLAAAAFASYHCCCTPMGAKLLQRLPNRQTQFPGGRYSRLDTNGFDDEDDHNDEGLMHEDHVLHVETPGTFGDDSATAAAVNQTDKGNGNNKSDANPALQHSGLAI